MSEPPGRYLPPPTPLRTEHDVRAFGLTYRRLRYEDGSDLYITPYGRHVRETLDPALWYFNQLYANHGRALDGGTGNVYRVPSDALSGKHEDLVVKFSRLAQGVPIHVEENFRDFVPDELADLARFNGPFEEFGLVAALRASNAKRRAGDVVRVKRPLAIYSPARRWKKWQLDRTLGQFLPYQRAMRAEADRSPFPEKIELEFDRDYIMIYEWVKGEDAVSLQEAGLLAPAEVEALTHRVTQELASRGLRVLDNKPRHFILRQSRRTGELLRQHGRLVYALIDFELLQRIPPGR